MAFRTNKMPVLQEKSASGSVATFNTALAIPLVNGEFTIQAYQEGTGDPSPVNVRNIIPFNKLRIGMVNFNQFIENGNFATGDFWSPFSSYGTFSYANNEGTYTIISVANDRYQNTFRYGLYMTIGHKYFFTADYYVSKESRALIYNIGNAYIKDRVIQSGWSRIQSIMDATFQTSGRKSCYIGIEFCEDYDYQVGDTYKMKNVMCFDLTQLFGSRIADYLYNLESNQEGAGVALFRQLFYKDYYDYNVGGTWVSVASVNGDSYPDYAEVALGEDVYGGSYNSVSGKLLDTWTVIDMGLISWVYVSSSGGYFSPRFTQDKANGITNIICEIYKTSSSSSVSGMDNLSIKGANTTSGIYIRDTNYTDADLFQQAVNGKYMAFERKTPIESNIGATPIKTFNGANNIFCDTGDTSLTYKDLDIAKRGNFREVFKLPS